MWSPLKYKNEARQIGLDSVTLDASIEQIETVRNANLSIPAILTLRHLAKRCGVNVQNLRYFVNRFDAQAYRRFSIRKRSGGRRFIAIPSSDLMKTQKWINHFILKKLPVHSASHAFKSNSSIYKCAAQHCEAKWLIKIDISDFFSSISEIQVFRLFRDLGYQPLVAFELARLCTIESHPHSPRKDFMQWKVRRRNKTISDYSQQLLGYLPQGAPTSPLISNLVVKQLDRELNKLARQYKLTYTRYSDDICFSRHDSGFSRQVAATVIHEAYQHLGKAGYIANSRKTVIVPPSAKKIILGLNVDSDVPKLQKEFRDKIRQHLYYLKKFGATDHAHNRNFDSVWGFKCHLRGLIDFAKMIEPKRAGKWLIEFNEVDWPV